MLNPRYRGLPGARPLDVKYESKYGGNVIRSNGITDPEQDQASIHGKVHFNKDDFEDRRKRMNASGHVDRFYHIGDKSCFQVHYHDVLIAQGPLHDNDDDAEPAYSNSMAGNTGSVCATACVNGLKKTDLANYRFAGIARGSYDPRRPIKWDIAVVKVGTETIRNTGNETLVPGDIIAWGPPVKGYRYEASGKSKEQLPVGIYRVRKGNIDITGMYQTYFVAIHTAFSTWLQHKDATHSEADAKTVSDRARDSFIFQSDLLGEDVGLAKGFGSFKRVFAAFMFGLVDAAQRHMNEFRRNIRIESRGAPEGTDSQIWRMGGRGVGHNPKKARAAVLGETGAGVHAPGMRGANERKQLGVAMSGDWAAVVSFMMECQDYDRAMLANRVIGVVTKGGDSGDEVVVIIK